MSQSSAIFLDAYRELNAKRLFWVTLILSAVIVGAFALLGITPTGLKLVTYDIEIRDPAYWYKWVFSIVVGFWVAWGAVVLALISTAGIFPDFMAGGSIDLYFSRPIGRLRLFLLKYATGLLFTLLQASVFAVLAFVVFGLRGGQWNSTIFLIVPVVVCLYSYLFAITVLLGVWTRSTIAAVLLTVVAWALFFAVGWTEGKLFNLRTQQAYIARVMQKEVDDIDATLKDLKDHPSITNAFGIRESSLRSRRERAVAQAGKANEIHGQFATWHAIAYAVATVIPKTGETIDLFDRQLFNDNDLQSRTRADKTMIENVMRNADEDMKQQISLSKDAELEAERARRGRSILWVLGTSFGFEAVILTMAAWMFCRRDY
jgi:hypothetical protein